MAHNSHQSQAPPLLLWISILIAVVGHSSAHPAVVGSDSGSCPFATSSSCDHHHHHGEEHHHHHHHHHDVSEHSDVRRKLPEELAEEADLELERAPGLHHHHHHHDAHHHHHDDHHHAEHLISGLALWVSAMGCSLLVSMASLICLILLPVLFLNGKPSKMVVDALATFGAGAMLGDAFLHQLPHAFSGGHSHSHDHHIHDHDVHDHHEASHSHSIQDLSVGLSVLFGIVLFLLVEKLVRYVEEFSGKGTHAWGHHHHHHNHKNPSKLKADDAKDSRDEFSMTSSGKLAAECNLLKDEKEIDGRARLRNRVTVDDSPTDSKESDAANDVVTETSSSEASLSSSSSLVFGYLNLFSDGVHNFTDGMALGSAFLLYGSVGGWSRTLFLLAHELPQEVGDFGILVHSGFSVSKALFFNFLSALVALVGTALALLLGKYPGQSSLIEGFTAGGFIYIAVAGVLPEMNSGSTTFKNTAIQLISLILGMAVALCISLAE